MMILVMLCWDTVDTSWDSRLVPAPKGPHSCHAWGTGTCCWMPLLIEDRVVYTDAEVCLPHFYQHRFFYQTRNLGFTEGRINVICSWQMQLMSHSWLICSKKVKLSGAKDYFCVVCKSLVLFLNFQKTCTKISEVLPSSENIFAHFIALLRNVLQPSLL